MTSPVVLLEVREFGHRALVDIEKALAEKENKLHETWKNISLQLRSSHHGMEDDKENVEIDLKLLVVHLVSLHSERMVCTP